MGEGKLVIALGRIAMYSKGGIVEVTQATINENDEFYIGFPNGWCVLHVELLFMSNMKEADGRNFSDDCKTIYNGVERAEFSIQGKAVLRLHMKDILE